MLEVGWSILHYDNVVISKCRATFVICVLLLLSSTPLLPRPVVAVFDIELLRVSVEKQDQVRRDVTAQLGPADPTILVSSQNGAAIDVPKLLRVVMEYGGIVLMRYIEWGWGHHCIGWGLAAVVQYRTGRGNQPLCSQVVNL